MERRTSPVRESSLNNGEMPAGEMVLLLNNTPSWLPKRRDLPAHVGLIETMASVSILGMWPRSPLRYEAYESWEIVTATF